jgi:aspartyl-tRNA synthetase
MGNLLMFGRFSIKGRRMKRTHTCNALRKSDVGSRVTLVGWVDTLRDHGGIQFVDLRDRTGLTQIVFDPQHAAIQADLHHLRAESVIEVSGEVVARGQTEVNRKLPTGEIEVAAESLIIHNVSEVPPFRWRTPRLTGSVKT